MKLIYGVGHRDVPISSKKCYQTWVDILKRCYSDSYQKDRPTYKECTVCEDWLSFSVFENWFNENYIEGYHLDKDLLCLGNSKEYNPENCCFIPPKINSFILRSDATKGEFPTGVHYYPKRGKFQAYCCDVFTGKRKHLGYFQDPLSAHLAWKSYKHQLAIRLSEEFDNLPKKVVDKLCCKYL